MQYPVQLYVVWRSEAYTTAPDNSKKSTLDERSQRNYDYAQLLFSTFSRSIERPLNRGIGIPVYFVTDPIALDKTIQWDQAKETVVVFLIDLMMSADRTGCWEQAIETIHQRAIEDSSVMLLPIALHKFAFKLYEPAEEEMFNYIRLFVQSEEKKNEYLIRQVAFVLAELLFRQVEPDKNLRIFLSHARADGKYLAKEFQALVSKMDIDIGSFLDVKNIKKGALFSNAIREDIRCSLFLIIKTSVYHEREWCLKEVFEAKKSKRPILVLNTHKAPVDRVSPYLGNVPELQCEEDEEGNFIPTYAVVDALLLEAVRYFFQDQWLNALASKRLDLETVIFPRPPELLTIHPNRYKGYEWGLYPDPPLGDTETSMVKEYLDIPLTTGLLYLVDLYTPAISETVNPYHELTVGLSVSETATTEIHALKGLSHHHLQDAVVELMRYLFVTGVTCAYAGAFGEVGGVNFTKKFLDLVSMYKQKERPNQSGEKQQTKVVPSELSIVQHVAGRFELLSLEAEVEHKRVAHFEFHHLPPSAVPKGSRAEDMLGYTYMRQKMLKNHQDKSPTPQDFRSDAQIFIGGKLAGSKSITLGVVEEAYYAVKYGRPLYIIGAFGGVAGALSTLLQTGESPVLKASLEAHEQALDPDQVALYQQGAQELWGESPADLEQRVHYAPLRTFFLAAWNQDEPLNNGLSKEENLRLFKSINILEITGLVLKGLRQFFAASSAGPHLDAPDQPITNL